MNHWRRPQPIQPVKTLPSDYFKIIATMLVFAIGFIFLVLWTAGLVEAAEQCPTPGEPCKVLVITPQEEKMLIGQGGIMDTAAAGKMIELGSVATYFKGKIASAPMGEMKPKDESKPPADAK